MGIMKDTRLDNLDSEIEAAMRHSPLENPPSNIYIQVMNQIKHENIAPVFHVTWMDLAVSFSGSLSVSVFLIYCLFMPVPLKAEFTWLTRWLEYWGQVSLVWIVPVFTASAALAGGYTMYKSLRASV